MGLDAETGEEAWTLALPSWGTGVCAVSESANGDGIAGVIFATAYEPPEDQPSDADDSCSAVGAFDTATGELLWSEDLADQSPAPARSAQSGHIGVGDSVLSAGLGCRGVHRFDVSNGEMLSNHLDPDEACGHELGFTQDGAVSIEIAVDTDTDPPAIPAQAPMALFDPETNDRMWTTEVPASGAALNRVLATDPVTLDITTRREGENDPGAENRERRIVTYDDSGEPVHVLADGLDPSLSAQDEPGCQAVASAGVLVHTCPDNSELHALDLESGEELWGDQPEADDVYTLGIQDDQILVANRGGDAPLIAYDLLSGDPESLGTLALDPDYGLVRHSLWTGDRLYVYVRSGSQDADQLIAYET